MQTIDFKRFELNSGDAILDLGCGEGRHSLGAYLAGKDLTIIGLDLSQRDIKTSIDRRNESTPYVTEGANNNCQFIVGSGFHLPFSDGAFDKIICSEVLEHIHNYHDVLTEIQRVLKPSGKLAISVPRAWPEKICWWLSDAYHNVEGGHIRIFNAKKLRNTIEQFSFRCTGSHWAHALHVPYWWLRCLFWKQGNNFIITGLYHKLLVWDLMKKPRITRWVEKALNPLLGKSVVMYFNHTPNK